MGSNHLVREMQREPDRGSAEADLTKELIGA